MQAGINKISQLKMEPWGNVFKHVSIDNFRRMGNKILNTLRVALLNPVALIEKQVGKNNSMTIQYKKVILALQKPWTRSKDIIFGKV